MSSDTASDTVSEKLKDKVKDKTKVNIYRFKLSDDIILILRMQPKPEEIIRNMIPIGPLIESVLPVSKETRSLLMRLIPGYI